MPSLIDRDPGHRVAPMPSLVDSAPSLRASRPRLADAPPLEEIGARRAPRSVLEAAVLSERQGSLKPQDLSAFAADEAQERHAPSAPMPLAQVDSAPPASSGALSRIASLLPADSSLSQAQGGGPRLQDTTMDIPAPARHQAQAMSERKRATTIEGPLHGRRILHAEIPAFPAWAQAQGVLEALVRIRFTVDPSGKVLDDIQLVQTSGYGELDRLAMDSLRSWVFEPKDESAGIEWGIINFRFVME